MRIWSNAHIFVSRHTNCGGIGSKSRVNPRRHLEDEFYESIDDLFDLSYCIFKLNWDKGVVRFRFMHIEKREGDNKIFRVLHSEVEHQGKG